MSTSNNNVWKVFGKVYCLNQDSRPDRWKQATEEFERVGLEVTRFPSLPADQPIKSFCLSQYAMLKRFLTTGEEVLLALEDDVIFQHLDALPKALADLPACWHILYLGANITGGVTNIVERPPVAISPNLTRVRAAWTSHAIAYTREAAKRITRLYDGVSMYDAWLSENILPELNCYLVNPIVAVQRPGKSDIWGIETDYLPCFEESNKIMAQ